MNASTVSPAELQSKLQSSVPPLVIDVRPALAFRDAGTFVVVGLRRVGRHKTHGWNPDLLR